MKNNEVKYELYYMENGRKVMYFGEFNEKQSKRIIKRNDKRGLHTFKQAII